MRRQFSRFISVILPSPAPHLAVLFVVKKCKIDARFYVGVILENFTLSITPIKHRRKHNFYYRGRFVLKRIISTTAQRGHYANVCNYILLKAPTMGKRSH